jgi:hypothetical protein
MIDVILVEIRFHNEDSLKIKNLTQSGHEYQQLHLTNYTFLTNNNILLTDIYK